MKDSPPAEHYRRLRDRYPECFDALENLGSSLRDAGPIPDAQAHLIQLAAAATLRSEGAVHSHTRRALAAGARAEEIRHALLLLTSTIGFPNVAAAMSWADEAILGE